MNKCMRLLIVNIMKCIPIYGAQWARFGIIFNMHISRYGCFNSIYISIHALWTGSCVLYNVLFNQSFNAKKSFPLNKHHHHYEKKIHVAINRFCQSKAFQKKKNTHTFSHSDTKHRRIFIALLMFTLITIEVIFLSNWQRKSCAFNRIVVPHLVRLSWSWKREEPNWQLRNDKMDTLTNSKLVSTFNCIWIYFQFCSHFTSKIKSIIRKSWSIPV